MTSGAVAMERLLIIQRDQFGADFQFDGREFRQQFRFRIGARVAIATDGAHGIRIFLG
jgi:hypothetical protein